MTLGGSIPDTLLYVFQGEGPLGKQNTFKHFITSKSAHSRYDLENCPYDFPNFLHVALEQKSKNFSKSQDVGRFPPSPPKSPPKSDFFDDFLEIQNISSGFDQSVFCVDGKVRVLITLSNFDLWLFPVWLFGFEIFYQKKHLFSPILENKRFRHVGHINCLLINAIKLVGIVFGTSLMFLNFSWLL